MFRINRFRLATLAFVLLAIFMSTNLVHAQDAAQIE